MNRVSERRRIRCKVNGHDIDREVPVTQLLVDFIREDLNLTGTKRSCDVQVCGVCTVLVDGRPVSACTYLAFEADGAEIQTIEGLASGSELHPIQQAFLDENATQCGYCTPGMILATKSLLEDDAQPNRERIRDYLKGNLCRCTGYQPILSAVVLASERIRHD